jgi:hypothetical protein
VTRIKVPVAEADVDAPDQPPAGLEVLQPADGQGPTGSADGDRAAASELRPVDGLAQNLPVQLTSFVFTALGTGRSGCSGPTTCSQSASGRFAPS